MTIVYKPPEPHSCPAHLFMDVGRAEIFPYGTIAKCRCGQYCYVTSAPMFSRKYWHPVKWFNFSLKKRIKNANTQSRV